MGIRPKTIHPRLGRNQQNGADTADVGVGPAYQAWPENAAQHEKAQKDKEHEHHNEEEGGKEHAQGLKLQRTMGYLEEERDDGARDMFTDGLKALGRRTIVEFPEWLVKCANLVKEASR